MNRTSSSEQTSVDDLEAAKAPSPSERPGLKILHAYAGNMYGGIETLLATLARTAHLEPSMKMEFALCFPGRLRNELEAAGAFVHDLGPVKFRYPWTIIRARRRLAKLLKQQSIDIVVTHACWPHALLAPTSRRARRQIVFWQHNFAGTNHWIERLAALTRPNLVISNSRASAATLPRLFPSMPTEVIHCPVSPPPPSAEKARDRAILRRELDTPEEAVVVIQASRLERLKGQAVLLNALGLLRDRRDWVAWIVGGAQRPPEKVYLAELEAQAATLGIADRVRFLGQRSDVPRLLASADVHCQSNTGPETFGIAFIEAMYAGLPVVSTRMGGAVEIITEECGILVEPGDVAGLADTLLRLIDDPTVRTLLGGAGPARAEELSDPCRVLHRFFRTLSGPVDIMTARPGG